MPFCNTPYSNQAKNADFEKLQVQPTVAIHGPYVRPRPVLVVRGSPLQPLPSQAQKNRLSLDSRTDPRSVDQTMVCGLCLWIKTSFTQPLTQTTINQHRPSFDPRSVGLTVDEGQQPVS
ncbi:hypothetical protein MTR67_019281 [Solanum verrucosum]|uniref:Late blight resistance protein n=1 Tax=Solanum verrucosum TaxID=315347 RepID=A0AAF0TN44_SOLVR|nr:hypothetical protein MTR67_019281 [Solanum verrucosum]